MIFMESLSDPVDQVIRRHEIQLELSVPYLLIGKTAKRQRF